MFKSIIQFWKGEDFLNKVLEKFKCMLEEGEEMFTSACRQLIHHENIPGLKEKIYSIDRKVNKQERDIRRRVIEHLTAQPSVDIPISLLLMSVVKDAERLGDYAKNLYEVNNLLTKPINNEDYAKLFNHVEEDIKKLFQQTKKAFLESDEIIAKESWNIERGIVKRCDKIIKELAQSQVTVNEAVCFTLMARHFKRLAAHLTNIATSVILPVSDLDYFDEERVKKAESGT